MYQYINRHHKAAFQINYPLYKPFFHHIDKTNDKRIYNMNIDLQLLVNKT